MALRLDHFYGEKYLLCQWATEECAMATCLRALLDTTYESSLSDIMSRNSNTTFYGSATTHASRDTRLWRSLTQGGSWATLHCLPYQPCRVLGESQGITELAALNRVQTPETVTTVWYHFSTMKKLDCTLEDREEAVKRKNTAIKLCRDFLKSDSILIPSIYILSDKRV